ncbi:aminotransferase class III-fold pyridoxal phosphate-dependent enzyme, partial [Maribacter dokdonensis]
VQGAAGMKFHSAKGLNELIEICQEEHILCIADEIMTGFGKTGKNFASDYLENKPDIMCLSKALTAGMFPLSITSCSQAVYNGFLSDEVHKGFFHAHTFSAHPLGCAAALAGIKLLNSPEIVKKRSAINRAHNIYVQEIKSHPKVAEVRVKGVILAIDLNIETERYGNLRDKLYSFFLERGVLLRPLGNTVYVLPPYVIKKGELQKVYQAITEALNTF